VFWSAIFILTTVVAFAGWAALTFLSRAAQGDGCMSDRRFYEGWAGEDVRRSAPAALRNREPIADVLAGWLPKSGTVLEVASETHPDALASINAWRKESGRRNLRAPIVLDAISADWPLDRADAVLNINMVHISPWEASLGLIAGAARLLPIDGSLILYGPWLKDDIETVPSNLAFDENLKARDPEWGLRRVEDFAAAAAEEDFELFDWRQMPANNLMLLFRRADDERT
jgi:hypothetical protein